jgi:uncharacterized membrane protein YdbT with pleckstrin-like domain
MRSFTGRVLLAGALALLVWGGGLAAAVPLPGMLIAIAGLLPLLIAVGWAWLVRLGNEYRVFEDSVEVQTGVVSRRIDNIQLFRVRDLGLSQGLAGRLLGVGDVTITSTDQSAPRFSLRGVDDPRRLYDTLRGLVSRSQATRRTMIVEREER